ncbi:MAG: ATP-binding protein [Candidatus Binatia bacterium]
MEALLTTLARALGLDRAALLIGEAPGRPYRSIARHGPVRVHSVSPGEQPGDGPWSAVLPVGRADRTPGLLLVARPDGATLTGNDAGLAQQCAEAFAQLLEHGALAAELAHSRDLLARADRLAMIGTLAAGVAHEIRNPLVSVRTFLQLLPEREADEEFRTKFRDLTLAETERIANLLNDLLAFARPTVTEPELGDLNALVSQTTRLLEAEARKTGIPVTCELAMELPLILMDEAQVKQVLMNVVLNAVEATGARGRVEVSTDVQEDREGRWAVVAVSDEGAGISPDQAARIFDPFFSTKGTGSGLGLFIANRIMTAHGGRIRVTPRPAGGTVFRLLFPLGEEPGHARTA